MEFFCVLSVGGSLASYQVQQAVDEAYTAVLRSNSGNRDDIPAEIRLKKEAGHWQAEPWHKEVVQGLIRAIESNH